MKDNIKEIKPGIGLGELKFGISRDQVKSLLGEPDDIDAYSYTDSDTDLTEDWYYDELFLSIGFDEEDDWRLVTIALNSNSYEFDNKKLVGLKREELLDVLKELKVDDIEFEDWSGDGNPDHKLISSEEKALNIWLDEGIVTEIQIGPLYNNDETINWPE